MGDETGNFKQNTAFILDRQFWNQEVSQKEKGEVILSYIQIVYDVILGTQQNHVESLCLKIY